MTEANQFFRPVSDFFQREVVTCGANARVVDLALTMHDKNVSSVVVLDRDLPIGIVTDRDLRNKVVACGRDPSTANAADIMNAPLAVIGERDMLYEALYRMSRLKIHRLVVVDGDGRLAGIITDTDILRLQAHSPHQLVLDIEKAATPADLKQLHARIQTLVSNLSGIGVPIRDMVKLIANLNDQVQIRLIALLRADPRHADLPDDFAYVVMGSEGRSEQTLSTDQDNAIIYGDALDAAQVAHIEAFSHDFIDALIAIGVPPCPGGIMAKNAAWRRSLAAWKSALEGWLSTPTPDNVMTGSMFMDLRPLYGRTELVSELREHAFRLMSEDRGFLMRMAHNMTRFLPPLGWFGRIKVERAGEHRGKLDIKKAGIFAITDGVKALAIEARTLDGSTHDRIEALVDADVLDEADAADLRASFDLLVHMRLRAHVEALRAGREPNNYIELARLNAMEKGKLRLALEGVARFQGYIKRHFNLHLLPS